MKNILDNNSLEAAAVMRICLKILWSCTMYTLPTVGGIIFDWRQSWLWIRCFFTLVQISSTTYLVYNNKKYYFITIKLFLWLILAFFNHYFQYSRCIRLIYFFDLIFRHWCEPLVSTYRSHNGQEVTWSVRKYWTIQSASWIWRSEKVAVVEGIYPSAACPLLAWFTVLLA